MSDEPIDYRDLLRRYVTHVLLSEGATFIGEHDFDPDPVVGGSGVPFTEAEQAELLAMDEQAWPVYRERSDRRFNRQSDPT